MYVACRRSQERLDTPGKAALDNANTCPVRRERPGIGIRSTNRRSCSRHSSRRTRDRAPPRRHRARLAISRELAQLLGGEISSEHAGARQHISPLPPRRLRRRDRATRARAASRLRPEWRRSHPRRRPRRGRSADDRASSLAGDCVMLIAGTIPDYARILVDAARRRGFPVPRRVRGATRSCSPANSGPRRLPRHRLARHARLGRARSVEAGSANAARAGADPHGRGRPAAGAVARRVFLSHEARSARIARQSLRGRAAFLASASAAARRRPERRERTGHDARSWPATTSELASASSGAAALGLLGRARLRLRRARVRAARHGRARSDRARRGDVQNRAFVPFVVYAARITSARKISSGCAPRRGTVS